jgi:hypothetical protein
MNNDKKELESLGQLNVTFINSLRNIIEPFVKKLEAIHRNKVELNESELTNLKQSINLIKIYSSKEASTSKFLVNRFEKDIIDDINHELAIVMKIANDAQKGKLESLYADCEELQSKLIKLEQDIEKNILSQERLVA